MYDTNPNARHMKSFLRSMDQIIDFLFRQTRGKRPDIRSPHPGNHSHRSQNSNRQFLSASHHSLKTIQQQGYTRKSAGISARLIRTGNIKHLEIQEISSPS
jgi:hypothetical protein